MFLHHLSRGQAYTWLFALFTTLLIASGFFVGKETSTAISRAAPSPKIDVLHSNLDNTHLLHERHHHHQTPPLNHSSLVRREDYSCGKGRPCANGACCGESGFCGYGPASCGTGCISNCNAHAECGQYSDPANKKCPLNTCCSKHGFCGTTKVSQSCSSWCFCLDDKLTVIFPCVGLLYRWLPVKLCPQPFAAQL